MLQAEEKLHKVALLRNIFLARCKLDKLQKLLKSVNICTKRSKAEVGKQVPCDGRGIMKPLTHCVT